MILIQEGVTCPHCGHDGFEMVDGDSPVGRLRCTACGHVETRQNLEATGRRTEAEDEATGRPEDSEDITATGSGSGV